MSHLQARLKAYLAMLLGCLLRGNTTKQMTE